MTTSLTRSERRLLQALHARMADSGLDAWMPQVTKLGNGGVVWVAIACAMLASPKHRTTGATLGAGLIASSIVCNGILKRQIARDRPCWRADAPELLIPMPKDYSFPSGHTMSSFLSATILAKADRRYGVPAFGLASLIALSRLYLQVHYPSDILAGAGMGVALGALCHKVSSSIAAKSDNKPPSP